MNLYWYTRLDDDGSTFMIKGIQRHLLSTFISIISTFLTGIPLMKKKLFLFIRIVANMKLRADKTMA